MNFDHIMQLLRINCSCVSLIWVCDPRWRSHIGLEQDQRVIWSLCTSLSWFWCSYFETLEKELYSVQLFLYNPWLSFRSLRGTDAWSMVKIMCVWDLDHKIIVVKETTLQICLVFIMQRSQERGGIGLDFVSFLSDCLIVVNRRSVKGFYDIYAVLVIYITERERL